MSVEQTVKLIIWLVCALRSCRDYIRITWGKWVFHFVVECDTCLVAKEKSVSIKNAATLRLRGRIHSGSCIRHHHQIFLHLYDLPYTMPGFLAERLVLFGDNAHVTSDTMVSALLGSTKNELYYSYVFTLSLVDWKLG